MDTISVNQRKRRREARHRDATDRGHVLREAILCCRKGGTLSIPGAYVGTVDQLPFGALAAARDGLEGTLHWYFSPNSGYSKHYGFLHIVSERRAIRQDVDWQDLGGEVSDTQLWQLKDAAYFQGCIDLPTFCERLACFFAGTEAIALSLCLPGFYDREF